MALPALVAPVLGFLFRTGTIKYIVFTVFSLLMTVLLPMVIDLILPFIGVENLSSAFGAASPEIWFFLDFFQISYGVPLMISAFVTRFLIRRLPIVG